MRWMTTCLIVLSLLGLTARTRAEDPLVPTIDALTSAGRCVEALALLTHANMSPAARSGRRALCESQLGHHAEAATLVADALRSPNDPWVVAHQEALFDALISTTRSACAIPPAPEARVAEPAVERVTANPYYYSSAERPARARAAERMPVPAAYADATVVNPYYLHE